ncbi:hypothetical protein B0H13DRAFT_1923071 [Mycena leptocephala]|nr:hypothetical protein B0H13DRAFT_1923071 [Mycena leptocephala]
MNLDAKTPGQQESQKEGETSDADESKEIQRIAEYLIRDGYNMTRHAVALLGRKRRRFEKQFHDLAENPHNVYLKSLTYAFNDSSQSWNIYGGYMPHKKYHYSAIRDSVPFFSQWRSLRGHNGVHSLADAFDGHRASLEILEPRQLKCWWEGWGLGKMSAEAPT